MSRKFFTNDGENTLLEKFKVVFRYNPYIAEFDALAFFIHNNYPHFCNHHLIPKYRTEA